MPEYRDVDLIAIWSGVLQTGAILNFETDVLRRVGCSARIGKPGMPPKAGTCRAGYDD